MKPFWNNITYGISINSGLNKYELTYAPKICETRLKNAKSKRKYTIHWKTCLKLLRTSRNSFNSFNNKICYRISHLKQSIFVVYLNYRNLTQFSIKNGHKSYSKGFYLSGSDSSMGPSVCPCVTRMRSTGHR